MARLSPRGIWFTATGSPTTHAHSCGLGLVGGTNMIAANAREIEKKLSSPEMVIGSRKNLKKQDEMVPEKTWSCGEPIFGSSASMGIGNKALFPPKGFSPHDQTSRRQPQSRRLHPAGVDQCHAPLQADETSDRLSNSKAGTSISALSMPSVKCWSVHLKTSMTTAASTRKQGHSFSLREAASTQSLRSQPKLFTRAREFLGRRFPTPPPAAFLAMAISGVLSPGRLNESISGSMSAGLITPS